MTKHFQPVIKTIDEKREFACSPVAVLAIIVNDQEEILLMANPNQSGGWEVINGAMEAGETPLEAILRETHEEAGSEIRVHPLGTVHTSAFHYDERVQYMLSITYLLAYEGGKIQPGDDMQGSKYRWWRLDDIGDEDFELIIPPGEKWLIDRAIDLYRLWRNEGNDNLPGFNLSIRGKTK